MVVAIVELHGGLWGEAGREGLDPAALSGEEGGGTEGGGDVQGGVVGVHVVVGVGSRDANDPEWSATLARTRREATLQRTMPLNYSKWDQLELSDDSDIEGHPNVDKRSLIRWKQRDIHEKREARKHKIEALTAEIACNAVLHPRLARIRQRIAGAPPTAVGDLAEDAAAGQSQTGLPFFQYLVDRLQSSPSPAAPPTNAQDQPTYDAMILSLLFQIYDTVKVLPQDEQEKAVLDGITKHIIQLSDHTRKLEADLDAELKEQKKHITSDDIHEGWESKVYQSCPLPTVLTLYDVLQYVPPKPTPPPIKNAISDTTADTKTTTTKTTTYEVLNPVASSSTAAPPPSAADASKDEDDQQEDLPELTPSLTRFSRLPLWEYAQSFAFIQANRDVVVPGASDALLVAAFQAETDGSEKYAKQCVHQSLLLQYCDKLGRDGVRVFFQKWVAPSPP